MSRLDNVNERRPVGDNDSRSEADTPRAPTRTGRGTPGNGTHQPSKRSGPSGGTGVRDETVDAVSHNGKRRRSRTTQWSREGRRLCRNSNPAGTVDDGRTQSPPSKAEPHIGRRDDEVNGESGVDYEGSRPMTMAEKTARFMLLLIFVVAFLSLMWAEILYYASATAVSTPVSSTDAIFDICLVNRECSQRFFISEDTAYDRAVFADLWTQRVRKPNKDEWNAQALDVFYAICGFQPTFDNVTQSPAAAQWPTPECVANVIALSDSSPPCGVNEKYMLNVGCRCPAGKVCPKDIDSDGVGVRQSDRLFVRIALGAIILFVLGGAYILLERSQRTHNAVTGERAHQE